MKISSSKRHTLTGAIIAVLISFLGMGIHSALANDDHYLSYKVKSVEEFVKQEVSLDDQFLDDVVFRVNNPMTFLVPTDKNEEFFHESETHLISYVISTSEELPIEDNLLSIKNQFHEDFIEISVSPVPNRLLVPATKLSVDGDDTGETGLPEDTNHYLCYPIFYSFEKLSVMVENQFTDLREQMVITPRHFCNPVDKNEEGITNPNDNLVCYIAKPHRDNPDRHKVETLDQFGELTFETNKEKEFCVPTEQMGVDDVPKIAFVTSSTHTGDLGGLSGADDICQNLADATNVAGGTNIGAPKQYLAWLSIVDEDSPSTRFIASPFGYVRVDGVPIMTTYDPAVAVPELLAHINVTESNMVVTGSFIWTNTDNDGTPRSSFDCDGWTLPTGFGGANGQNVASLSAWTRGGITFCSREHRVYCFEQ